MGLACVSPKCLLKVMSLMVDVDDTKVSEGDFNSMNAKDIMFERNVYSWCASVVACTLLYL